MSLPNDAKLELYRNIIGTFLKQERIGGKIYVLGRSSFFWNERVIEVDTRKQLLKMSRKNMKKEPHVIDLT